MIYNLLNGGGIIAGALLGMLFRKGIPEKISNALMKAFALVVMSIGLTNSIAGENFMVIIPSLAIGTVIGEIIDFDKLINNLGDFLQSKFTKQDDNSGFSKGFVTTTILFCAGAMGIVGSLQAGLTNDGSTLIAKTMLDTICACIFTATLGYGVLFSAFSVVIYQGIFVLLASVLSSHLGDAVIVSISAVGGITVFGLGFNMLLDTKIKVANMVPGVFIPIIFEIFGIV